MKLDAINKLKHDYAKELASGEEVPDSLFRRCILEWKKNFEIDEIRLAPVLEKSLRNKVSGRYWGGEKNSVKSGLVMLAAQNYDLFYEAIKDLFNEERMIIMRANRFIHHCDMIFKDRKSKEQKINTHYQNYYSASLLLSLEHPERYCLFDFRAFEPFCKLIGVMDMPVDTDLERYYKIVRTVYKLVSKDEEFMNLYYSKLEPDVYFGPSLSVVYDMIRYVSMTVR